MLKLAVVVLLALLAVSNALEREREKEADTFVQVETLAKQLAKDVIKGAKSGAEGAAKKALDLIKKRAQALKSRRRVCKRKETVPQRDDCLTQLRKDKKRNKAQRNLVKRLRRCSSARNRKKCVKRVALAYLKLRPVKVVLKQEAEVVGKLVEKAANDLAAGKKSALRKEVAAAIAELYKRLGDIRKAEKKCKSLESGANFKECMKPVKRALRRNRRARKLVKRLRRCQRKRSAKRRARCARKYEERLLAIVKPPKGNEAPNNVEELDAAVVSSAEKRLLKIAKLRADLEKCESNKCRRQLRRQIRQLERAIDELRGRYSPRRKCLRQRQAMRKKEFRLRAREHSLLTRIHRRATECTTVRCTAKEELQQRKLEKEVERRRKAFLKEWQKLRCPFVAPASNLKAVKKSLKKIERGSLKSLRSMRQRLVELYAKLDECDTGACREKVRADIKDLKKLIALLVSVQQRTLRKKRADHRKRARLNRLLTKYYLLAADCSTQRCRQAYRAKLRDVNAQLAKLNRDELGRRTKAFTGMNKYYRLLQKALKRCPRSSLGNDCRKLVVHAFRAGTELRVKALILYLREKAQRQAKRDTAKCGADKACVAKVQEALQKRLAQLQVRDMRINKRRALRLCELTANQAKCRADVEKEFSRDKKIAQVNAAKEASVVVKGVQAKAEDKKKEAAAVAQAPATPVKRAGSASALTVSMAILAVVAAALLF